MTYRDLWTNLGFGMLMAFSFMVVLALVAKIIDKLIAWIEKQ